MYKHFIFLLFVLTFSCCHCFSQQKTLQEKNYTFLEQQISLKSNDSLLRKPLLDAFLNKAQKEKNTEKLLHFYTYYLFMDNESNFIRNADSALFYAKKMQDNKLIGNAYLSRGTVFFHKKEYKKTLDDFIVAKKFADKTDDEYLKHKIKFNIANIKYYLGFYEEAIVLFKECVVYFDQEGYNNNQGFLNSIGGLAICYTKLGNYDLSLETTKIGIKRATEIGFELDVKYLTKTEGLNNFYKKNYAVAIQKIQEALPAIIKNEDIGPESTGYFYIGKSYLSLNQREKALPYFLKVDSLFTKKGFINPELRENYEILIAHYKKKEDSKKELFYINRLIKADSILNSNFKYLSHKIYKEFDSKVLLEEKKSLENQLEKTKKNSKYFGITALFSGIGLIISVIIYYKKQKLYKKKYELLLKEKDRPAIVSKSKEKPLGINEEVVSDILKKLAFFEKNQEYLTPNMTLPKLSELFKTNTSYLSKVINHYKEKSFANYVNDLRIDYITEIIRNDAVYQKYTIKALSEMTGFGSAQQFSDAFYLRTELRPSFFISEAGTRFLRVL